MSTTSCFPAASIAATISANTFTTSITVWRITPLARRALRLNRRTATQRRPSSVIRYLVMSTLIVLAIAIVIAALGQSRPHSFEIASVYARVPAKPGCSQSPASGSSASLRGDAPWVAFGASGVSASASESRGTPLYVRAHLPPNSVADRAAR